MQIGKIGRKSFLIGAALVGSQAASLASPPPPVPVPAIYFTPGGSPPSLPELTDSTSATGNGANTGFFTPPGGTNNILDVVGSHSIYVPGYVNDINNSATGDQSDYVKVAGFDPPTDAIFAALKLDNNGTPIDPSNSTVINAIITDINTANDATFGSSALASTITGSFNNVFGGYDILLSFPPAYTGTRTTGTGANGQFDFGFNFTGYSDSGAGVGTITVTDVGVVPEPGCLGLLSAAGLLLLPRYRRN